jgi:hypothetical protein
MRHKLLPGLIADFFIYPSDRNPCINLMRLDLNASQPNNLICLHLKFSPRLEKNSKKAAVPAKAPEMQAYMKSKMPYHGVQTPMRRLICKQLFKDLEFKNAEHWEREVRAIWEGAWWDYVGTLAADRVGGILNSSPQRGQTLRCSKSRPTRSAQSQRSSEEPLLNLLP